MDFTLSDETRQYMYQEFAARDTKGSGYINSNLLAECIKSMGISILDEDVVYLKKHFDINGDGGLSIKELVNNMGVINAHCQHREELMKAFALFDVDNAGYIRLPNMLKILTYNDFMGVKEARAYLDTLCRKYDKNFDGRFDYGEFIEMFMSENLLSDHFGKEPEKT